MDANTLNHAFGCGARETKSVAAIQIARGGALVTANFPGAFSLSGSAGVPPSTVTRIANGLIASPGAPVTAAVMAVGLDEQRQLSA